MATLALNYLVTTEMLKTMFPNLNTLANICVTIPVGTASVERSFSHMKMIKIGLRNKFGEKNLSYILDENCNQITTKTDNDLYRNNRRHIWTRKCLGKLLYRILCISCYHELCH